MSLVRWISCGMLAVCCVAAGAQDKPPAPAPKADAAPPGAVAMLADGRTLEGVTVKPGAAPNQVVLERAGEAAVTVAAQDLLALEFAKVPGRPVTPALRLSNGDQLAGKVSFPSARQVKIAA